MKRLFAFLFAVVAFAACEDVSIETPPETPTTPSKITIVTPQPTIISDEGGEAVVEFVAPEPWVIKIDDTNSADWMEVEPMGGNAGSTKITITAEPNSAYDKRTAIVSIKAGTVEAAIAVTQSQKNGLVASEKEFEVDYQGGTIDFDVTTNVELTVIISDDAKEWISEVTTRAMVTKTLSFEIAPNKGDAERSGEITIAGGGLEQTVVVKQLCGIVPSNEIWYTSTDGNVVAPNRTDAFGSNIVSNVYKNGKGIITFDGDVTSIGRSAFVGCTSLTSITLPEGVNSIGEYAFDNCSSLSSITLPEGVTSIGYNAFYNCTSLTSITLPDGVTSIGERTFYNCSSLTSITLPDGVTSIGEHTFYKCTSLTSVTLPEGVTSIGRSAFVGCTSLTSITIPDSVTSIMGNPFSVCYSLTTFNGKYASADNRCLIVDGELKSFAPAGLISYTIPSGVTSIGSTAFSVCSSLESITIPSGVTSIGSAAFSGCSSLESITIPSSVTSIGGNPFSGCSSLTSFYGKYASTDNRCMIVDGELKAFAHAGLTSYTIPSGVTSIGDSAFKECTSMTSITLPDGVTSIGYDAFRNCSSLTSIILPDSVTSIGWYAFFSCSSLSSITLPANISSLGNNAFACCTSLTTIYSKNTTPPSVEYSTFSDCDSLMNIYVPTSSVSAYKNANGWNYYASFIEGYDFSN